VREIRHHWIGKLGWRCSYEAGAATAARVGVERELGHHQHLGLDVERRTVHLALVISETAQVCNFIDQFAANFRSVGRSPPNQDHPTPPNRAYNLTIDRDSGGGDTLQERAQSLFQAAELAVLGASVLVVLPEGVDSDFFVVTGFGSLDFPST